MAIEMGTCIVCAGRLFQTDGEPRACDNCLDTPAGKAAVKAVEQAEDKADKAAEKAAEDPAEKASKAKAAKAKAARAAKAKAAKADEAKAAEVAKPEPTFTPTSAPWQR